MRSTPFAAPLPVHIDLFRAGDHPVVPRIAVKRIVAGITLDVISTVATSDDIISIATEQRVVAAAATDRVIPAAAIQGIVPVEPFDKLADDGPFEHVITISGRYSHTDKIGLRQRSPWQHQGA